MFFIAKCPEQVWLPVGQERVITTQYLDELHCRYQVVEKTTWYLQCKKKSWFFTDRLSSILLFLIIFSEIQK